MANRNQKGPAGRGPLTGRGLGRCAGSSANDLRNDESLPRGGRGRVRGNGNGNGRGGGRGRGLGRRLASPASQDDSLSLVQEVRALRDELAELKKKLNNLGEHQ